MEKINWINTLSEAERKARTDKRLLFLFFHRQNCGGCSKTIEETLTHSEVIEAIESNCVPIMMEVTEDQSMVAKYKIEWTPTFIVADENGIELERWVGYLPAEDFISQLYLSEGLGLFHTEKYHDAEGMFETLLRKNANSEMAPEAKYFHGVSCFKEKGDVNDLKDTSKYMKEHYPNSTWTKRASAWI